MKILVGMMHPKHVHMFKNLIWELEKKDYDVDILLTRKDITEDLAQVYFKNYKLISENPDSLYKKVLKVVNWEYSTFKYAVKERPDIFIGQALPHFAHVSYLLNKPYLIFEDTETASLIQSICFPFATKIITPQCYQKNHGKKHMTFPGFYELAYLHPKYFTPDPIILDELSLNDDEKFSVVRFISWGAVHDMGQKGLNNDEKISLIKSIEQYGRVFITSEKKLPSELEKYKISLPAQKIHSLLNYASLYVGDSGTMATESALLGTPTVRFYSTHYNQLGNFIELEKKELIYNVSNFNELVNRSEKILSDDETQKIWKKKSHALMSNSIDVNAYMITIIKKYLELI